MEVIKTRASLEAQLIKESPCNVGQLGSIPGLGRSPGEGKGYPLQYSGLENSMDCRDHGVAKNRTWLTDFHFTSLIRTQVLEVALYLTSMRLILVSSTYSQVKWGGSIYSTGLSLELNVKVHKMVNAVPSTQSGDINDSLDYYYLYRDLKCKAESHQRQCHKTAWKEL